MRWHRDRTAPGCADRRRCGSWYWRCGLAGLAADGIGRGIVWTAVDNASAGATITDGPISVTMLFRFGADGQISSMHADDRAAPVGKTTVMMPRE
jgi:hypothetical protein